MATDEPAPARGVPSDQAPGVLAIGRGAVSGAVLSLSARHPDGDDATYLEWHLLDHLPEQYRIGAIRWGQRWVSTSRCRAARLVSAGPFDGVDHVMGYLLDDTSGPALDAFFELGGRLGAVGRMGLALPRVHVGVWDLREKVANPRALAGADVLPWRPNRGVHLVIDRPSDRPPDWTDPAAALAGIDGVAGLWRFRGTIGRHRRAQDGGDLEAVLCYLDGDPVDTAPAVDAALVRAGGGRVPASLLLAAPFETVVPFDWARVLPG